MTTTNPWTGQQERFEVCISDRGFREWEQDRTRLAERGYPDRPPEIETPLHRGWTAFRKPDVQAVSARRAIMDPAAIYRGSWLASSGSASAMVSVVKDENGWLLELLALNPITGPLCDVTRVARGDAAEIDVLSRQMLSLFTHGDPAWLSCEEILGEAALPFREVIERGPKEPATVAS